LAGGDHTITDNQIIFTGPNLGVSFCEKNQGLDQMSANLNSWLSAIFFGGLSPEQIRTLAGMADDEMTVGSKHIR